MSHGSHVTPPPTALGVACMQMGAADAKDSLTKLATNVSSWWANLDPVPKPAPTSPSGSQTIPAHHQQVCLIVTFHSLLYMHMEARCASCASVKPRRGIKRMRRVCAVLHAHWGNMYTGCFVNCGLLPQDTADLQARFGLSAEEELMESFQCSLAQQYACRHNPFTEPHEVGILRRSSWMTT